MLFDRVGLGPGKAFGDVFGFGGLTEVDQGRADGGDAFWEGFGPGLFFEFLFGFGSLH